MLILIITAQPYDTYKILWLSFIWCQLIFPSVLEFNHRHRLYRPQSHLTPLTLALTGVRWLLITLIASYCSLVSDCLPSFPDSVSGCSNPFCTQHHALLDEFCEQFSDCLRERALLSLPTVRKSAAVAGWNSGARLLKEKANFGIL